MKIFQSIYVFIRSLISSLVHKLRTFHHAQQGQGMVEYALIIALIAVVVIATLLLLGPAINDKFQEIIDAINPPTT